MALARGSGSEPVSVRRLADDQGVPYAFARGIQRDLVRAGLVVSHRGARGGIALAREARDISVLDVLEAVQGPVSCSVCTTDPNWCTQMGGCSVHRIWREADALVAAYLGKQDLAALAGDEKE